MKETYLIAYAIYNYFINNIVFIGHYQSRFLFIHKCFYVYPVHETLLFLIDNNNNNVVA